MYSVYKRTKTVSNTTVIIDIVKNPIKPATYEKYKVSKWLTK